MKLARVVFALALVYFMAWFAMAQQVGDNQGSGGGRGPGQRGSGGTDIAPRFEGLAAAVKKLDLSAEQKTKVDALVTEYAPKFKELRDKADKILTPEQKKARDDAMKAARALGRDASREDRRAAFAKVRDAVKATDEQQKAMTAVSQDVRKLMEEVRPKINDILTPDQQTKLRESMRGPGGPRRNRGGNAPAAPSTT